MGLVVDGSMDLGTHLWHPPQIFLQGRMTSQRERAWDRDSLITLNALSNLRLLLVINNKLLIYKIVRLSIHDHVIHVTLMDNISTHSWPFPCDTNRQHHFHSLMTKAWFSIATQAQAQALDCLFHCENGVNASMSTSTRIKFFSFLVLVLASRLFPLDIKLFHLCFHLCLHR